MKYFDTKKIIDFIYKNISIKQFCHTSIKNLGRKENGLKSSININLSSMDLVL